MASQSSASSRLVQDTYSFFNNLAAGGVAKALEFGAGNNLTELMDKYGLEFDETGVVAISMLIAIAEFPGYTGLRSDGGYEVPTFTNKKKGVSTQVSPADDNDDDETVSFGRVYAAVGFAKQWILDLAACEQTRPLKEKNIVGYFSSMSNTSVTGRVILPFVRFAASMLPNVVSDSTLRPRLTNNKFMRYHTVSSSTPGLVSRAIADFNTLDIFTSKTVEAVNTALSSYWDLRLTEHIPQRAIVFSYLYYQSIDFDFGDWYQGDKAIKASSGSFIQTLKAFFKEYNKMTSNVLGMKDLPSTAELAKVMTNSAGTL